MDLKPIMLAMLATTVLFAVLIPGQAAQDTGMMLPPLSEMIAPIIPE